MKDKPTTISEVYHSVREDFFKQGKRVDERTIRERAEAIIDDMVERGEWSYDNKPQSMACGLTREEIDDLRRNEDFSLDSHYNSLVSRQRYHSK